jgi:hypothetical protein
MEHSEAVRLMMVERYILGELSANERETFEEHFFACQDCASDLRSEATFLDHSKILLAAADAETRKGKVEAAKSKWQAWFKPAFALPVIAVLAVLLGYESFVAIPQARHRSRNPEALPALSLINAATRGGTEEHLNVRRGQPFLLFVDIPGDSRYVSYSARMLDTSGRELWSLPVTSVAAKDTVSIRIPGQQNSGAYTLVVRGVMNDGSTNELERLPFQLQVAR